MSAIQPSDLIERLMAVSGASSQEDLARKLDVPLRTLQRWSTNEVGPGFGKAIELLERAGWLNTTADTPVVPRSSPALPEDIRGDLARLLVGQGEILAELKELRSGTAEHPQASPRRSRRR